MVKKQSPPAAPQPEPPAIPERVDLHSLEPIGVKVKVNLVYEPDIQEWSATMTSYISGSSLVIANSNDPDLDALLSRLISALKDKVEAIRRANAANQDSPQPGVEETESE